MASQLALLQVHLACQYLMPLNSSGIDIINGTFKTSNQLAMMNLYIACHSLASLNLPCIGINDSQATKSVYDQRPSIDPKVDLQMPLQPSAKLATQLPKGYTVYPDIGAAYKLYHEGKSWTQASEHCQREGANLAVIDTFEKAKYVMELKGSTSPPDIHIGIHRFTDDDQYVEIKTGAKLGTLPWIQTEHLSDITRKCAVVPYIGGGIVASHCDQYYNFVCEVSLLK